MDPPSTAECPLWVASGYELGDRREPFLRLVALILPRMSHLLAFARQFAWEEGAFVFRHRGRGPAIPTSEEEARVLCDAFEKRQRFGIFILAATGVITVGIWVGVVRANDLVLLASKPGAISLDPLLVVIGFAALIKLIENWTFRTTLPLRSRPPVAPALGYTGALARRWAAKPWRSVGANWTALGLVASVCLYVDRNDASFWWWVALLTPFALFLSCQTGVKWRHARGLA